MTLSNYEVTRNQMRSEFLKYDQEKMIRKYSLANDSEYLYMEFVKRLYRIDRRTGAVEWSYDAFRTCTEADYNESMTIYDVLCYAKDGCSLSGKYCSLNTLKGTVKSSVPGGYMFQKTAESFNGKVNELKAVCSVFGEESDLKGDAAFILYPFSFLPVPMQYWEADEEFPASLKFMFDENILDYMHYETIFLMTGHMLERIEELIKTGIELHSGRKV